MRMIRLSTAESHTGLRNGSQPRRTRTCARFTSSVRAWPRSVACVPVPCFHVRAYSVSVPSACVHDGSQADCAQNKSVLGMAIRTQIPQQSAAKARICRGYTLDRCGCSRCEAGAGSRSQCAIERSQITSRYPYLTFLVHLSCSLTSGEGGIWRSHSSWWINSYKTMGRHIWPKAEFRT
eukprot:6175684-Pleurochrysis_carterae.AAC.3